MLADQLHSHFAATLKGNVNEFGAGGFFQGDGDDLVFLLGAGTPHFHFGRAGGLDRRHEFLGILVRCFSIHPEHKLVERQHGNRGHVFPVERHAGGHGCGEQIGQCDDDLVRVTLGALDLQETLGTCTAGLVDDDHRLRHQLVLDDNALDESGHLVSTAAGAGRHDKFDRLGGFPGCMRRCGQQSRGRDRHGRNRTEVLSHFCKFGFHRFVSCY